MPQGVTVVTGPPFAGKSLWIADEISAREEDGELGLVSARLHGVCMRRRFPGWRVHFGTKPLSATGASRFAGYAV